MYCSSARGRERGGHRLFLRFPACAAPPSLFSGDREPSQQPIATTTDLILGMQTDTWGFLQEWLLSVSPSHRFFVEVEFEIARMRLRSIIPRLMLAKNVLVDLKHSLAKVHGLLHLFGYDHELSGEAEAEMEEEEERLLKNLEWKGK
ncbi:hypothetical protein LXL04_036410 [Taraxacum kok-saghyz]